jgi:PPOX class probable F420-dependent enzyme
VSELDEAREFLREHHRAVLVTRRSGDGLQTSPITLAVDAEGRAVISTVARSAKAHNLERDPRATLCAVNDGWFGAWAQVDGTAEIVRMPEALELLVDYYRLARGEEHPDWGEYRAAMLEQGRVLLRITLERAVLANR